MSPSVCLTMIVKDEAHVIGRCLDALKPYIDHAVIIDTGSTDDTEAKIKEILPGATIGHSPFISFQHNRTELLYLARKTYPDAEFHLMIDADDLWVPSSSFEWPELMEEDAYSLEHRLGDLSWWRTQVFRASKPFYYGGVAHEALACLSPFTSERLHGVRVKCGSDGARRLKEPIEKYRRVAAQLQADHDKNPNNRRTVFYLAQSYRDSLEREKALSYYEMRATMGGWDEEVWYSKYQIGRLHEMLGHPVEETLKAYLGAFCFRPSRSESMVAAASVCRRARQRGLQLIYSSVGIHVPYPHDDRLFVGWTTYAWKAWDEFAMACWHHGRMRDCIWANYQILCQSETVVDRVEDRIVTNISHASKPGDKLDALKSFWRAFRELDPEERNSYGLLNIAAHSTNTSEFHDEIMLAVECGGGSPK